MEIERSKFGMAENLMTDLVAFGLVTNVGGDDVTEQIRATSIGTTFSHNLIRILVVVSSQKELR